MLERLRGPLACLVSAMMSIALAMVPAVALAEGDWWYEGDGDGNYIIVKYFGYDEEVVIPSTLENRPVTAIGYEAFGSDYIESVVVPEGVTTIGGRAFVDCHNLSRVSLPASVTSIGEDSFHGCPETVYVYYAGTYEAWERIGKPEIWDSTGNVRTLRVYCAGPDTYSVSSEPERGGTAEANVVATYGLEDGHLKGDSS